MFVVAILYDSIKSFMEQLICYFPCGRNIHLIKIEQYLLYSYALRGIHRIIYFSHFLSVSPESIVIPIVSCIFGFPLLALLVICCLRRRAKMARERDRRRNYDMQDHAVSLVRFSPIHRLSESTKRSTNWDLLFFYLFQCFSCFAFFPNQTIIFESNFFCESFFLTIF